MGPQALNHFFLASNYYFWVWIHCLNWGVRKKKFWPPEPPLPTWGLGFWFRHLLTIILILTIAILVLVLILSTVTLVCYGTIISNVFFYLFSLSTILSLHLILSSHMTPQLRSTVLQHISVSQHMACACLSSLRYRPTVRLTLYTCLPFSIYSRPSSILVFSPILLESPPTSVSPRQ